MSHEVETMMSVRKTPWHGLGVVLANAPTIPEALTQSGLDWEVGTREVWDRHFIKASSSDESVTNVTNYRIAPAKVVYRKSDDSILGVVGTRYHPLQNHEAFKWFDPFLKEGLAHLTTAGSLMNGKVIWVMAEIGKEPIEILPGDDVRRYILLSNTHDGSRAVRIGFTPIRVVCNNTLGMAHENKNSSLVRLRHLSTLTSTMDELREAMNLANQTFEATAEQYRKLAKSKVFYRSSLVEYFKTVLDLQEEKSENKKTLYPSRRGLTKQSSDTLADLLKTYDSEAIGSDIPGVQGTWWGAFNAITEYLSYRRGRNQNTRLESLWFGNSAEVNQLALKYALELSQAI